MGFRFRKSFKVGPFRTTISKSGISTSVGVKGARITKRADGKTQTTLSVPGTGISYVKTGSGKTAAPHESAEKIVQTQKPQKERSGAFTPLLAIVGSILLFLILVSSCGSGKEPEPNKTETPVFSEEEKIAAQAQQRPEAESPEAAPVPEPTPEPDSKPEPEQKSEPKPELVPVPVVVPDPEPEPSAPPVADPVEEPVIGNKNSRKFHEPGCSSIGDIKESNKISIESYDTAISMGYEPCKRCY